MARLFVLILLIFSSILSVLPARALETVTLQLKWKHQFQFAGYYAAREKGFYKDAGLDVIIREAEPGKDPIEEVIMGRADFGVGTSELVLAHAEKAPVVVLAVIFQHSPLGIAISKQNELVTLQDIVNQKVMIEANSAELFAYLALEGIEKDKIEVIHHSFDIQDLASGKVSAMSVYVTDEPFALRSQNVDYALFEPRQGGIDFYGDNLFTTQTQIKSHPERTQKFREASLKGWKYAMDNPEEIIQLIYNRYSQRHSIEHLKFEASQMKRLMQPKLVEPGYMHQGRWQHIVDTYQNQGMLPLSYSLEGLLYEPATEVDLSQYKSWAIFTALLAIILAAGTVFIFRLNKKLSANKMWLETIVSNAPSALVITDKKGKIEAWNVQAEETFGWQKDEVIGKNAYDILLSNSKRKEVESFLDSSLNKDESVKSTLWNITKNHTAILCEWKNTLVCCDDKRKEYIVSMAIDITKQKQVEDKLKLRAYTDPLTGLSNRHIFYIKFNQAIRQSKRHNKKLAVMFIDLDGFKSINDSHGHEVGDYVLKLAAERIKDSCRETDIIARIGGDEFVVIVDDFKNRAVLTKVSEKILKSLIKPIETRSNKLIAVGASIGISLYPEHGENTEELLKIADLAMYKVKQGSKENLHVAEIESKLD